MENTLVNENEMAKQDGFIHAVRDINCKNNKKYNITTFGCQMNENESEMLAGILEAMGYIYSEKQEDCDLVLYNTCCVRENAELKVYGHLGALKALKRSKPDMVIALCGCMVQQKEVMENILKRYKHVDLVVGTQKLYKFPELLFNTLNSKKMVADTGEGDSFIAEGLPIKREQGMKAWLTVMYGCNNFCSYCIVPHVRGRERSRAEENIIDEARLLGHQGFKEITLLGQNVNSYGKDLKDGSSFGKLLRNLEDVEGLERIRFMTSHPKDLSDELIFAMRDCKKVCRHIHLPVQAGSNEVLKDMNRKYTREHYMVLVEKIRENIPGIAITTDIIVGYPGETDEDFEKTLELVEKVRFDYAYTFLYSRRTGTPAARKEEQVSEEIKKARFDALLELQNRISKEINDTLLGQTVEVLVEGLSKNSNQMLTGRTGTNKIVNFKGSLDLTGRLVNILIEDTGTWSLEGRIV